jgi:hypothetical protein
LIRSERGDCHYAIGKKPERIDRHIPWGDAPWDEYGSCVPPAEWAASDDADEVWAREQYEEWLAEHDPSYAVFPVWFGNVHGPGSFAMRHAEYDGADGFILVRKETGALEQLGALGTRRLTSMQQADAFIAAYEKWARGEICGWVVEDSDGECLDSVWGYDDEAMCMEEGIAAATALSTATKQVQVCVLFKGGTWGKASVSVPLHVGESKCAAWIWANHVDRTAVLGVALVTDVQGSD